MGGLRSSSSAAAAIVAIVVVPSLVGQVTAPDEPEAPKPIDASITTRVSGDELVDADTARLRIRAKGEPPSSGVLTTSSGLQKVMVGEVPASDCKGLPEHRVASSEAQSQWCLALDGIEAGQQVVGKLGAPETTLTLTVSRRVSFWPFPFLVVLGGLFVGALVGLLPGLLRKRVRRGLLESALAQNDAADPTARVESLGEWVAVRLEAGDSADDLLPVVKAILLEGPAKARAARAALLDRLSRSTLDPDHGFVKAATLEAEKPTHTRQDFLKDDGTRRGHPAYEWITAIAELERQGKELVALPGLIAALPEPQREKPNEKLREARSAFGSVDRPSEVSAVDSKITAVQEAIVHERQGLKPPVETPYLHLALSRFSGQLEDGGSEYEAAPAGAGSKRALSTSPVEAVGRAKSKLAPWAIATAALVSVVVVWAFVTIEQTLYAPKEAFGSWPDYFALLTGAIGSGAAGAVIALVGIWLPLKPSEE